MKIRITGASGYLGVIISKKLEARNHEVKSIHRNLLYGKKELLKAEIKNCDVIINLAGATILTRWTAKKMKVIYDSRVLTTRNLVSAINELNPENRPKKFISASAIGIYEAGKAHDENSFDFDEGFVGKVVKDWEEPLNDISGSVQKMVFRIGPVLGKKSATIRNMLLPFKLGLGGRIGNGKQAFPFVHEEDVGNAFLWAVENHNGNQIFNLVAPQNISNLEFTNTFARLLNRPAIFRIPYFLLKLLYGKAAKILVTSPEVEPKALLNAGFEFSFSTIDSCLKEILN